MENVKNVAYGTHVTVIDKIDSEPVKLRVAAYARVSSDSEDQLNSYIAQVDFYTKYITTHEGWELVDIYADEGLTGMETKHRDDFNRMIQDCRDGKIDRVLVKSVSRFARNTQEYILYMRELLRLGITIYFEKENLDTGKMSNEQAAAIYGAFAQMETTGHSQNMRVSNRIRMEKGLFTLPQAPYGYKMVDRELAVIPEEAEVVKYIFTAFLNGNGKCDIAKKLNEAGVRRESKTGEWYPITIQYILSNTVYMGTQIWQKTCANDVMPFKQVKNIGQKPKYIVKDACPPIITEAEFDAAQSLMKKRRELRKPCEEIKSPYRGHIYCSVCGSPCRGKYINGRLYWVCLKHNRDKTLCPVQQISDDEIREVLHRFILKMKYGKEVILNTALAGFKELQKRELIRNNTITEIDTEISKLTERNHILEKLKAKGYMDPALYLSEQGEVNRRAWELRKIRRGIMEKTHDDTYIRQSEVMLDYLEDSSEATDLSSPDLFTMLIEKILLAPNGEIEIKTINGMEFKEDTKKAVR